MKIVFLGSGDFALTLVRRISEIHDIVAIVIGKPKPKGRGLKVEMPEIGKWAKSRNTVVLTPADPADVDFMDQVRKLKPDLFVLATYGHILKKDFLSIARWGGINIHPSLLPRYRGAAPIQRCLMNGDKKTGITIFFMDEKIDHGEIIFQEEMPIDPDDNYGSLSARLAEKAGSVINAVLDSVFNETYVRRKQEEGDRSPAPKIRKEEMDIDWRQPALVIHNLVRALAPRPGARTRFRNHELKVLKTSVDNGNARSGEVVVVNRCIAVGTGQGILILELLKPSNRRIMSGQDFVNGIRLRQGETLI